MNEAYSVLGGPVRDRHIMSFNRDDGFTDGVISLWDRRSDLEGMTLVNGVEEYRFNLNLDVSGKLKKKSLH